MLSPFHKNSCKRLPLRQDIMDNLREENAKLLLQIAGLQNDVVAACQQLKDEREVASARATRCFNLERAVEDMERQYSELESAVRCFLGEWEHDPYSSEMQKLAKGIEKVLEKVKR